MTLPMIVAAQGLIPANPPGTTSTQLATNLGGNTLGGIIIRVIEIALAIAGLIAILFVIIGGFRYVTAAGNEEAAESAKKTILNAIIGVVVIILSYVILRVIQNVLLNNIGA